MPAIFAFDGRGTTVMSVAAVAIGDVHLLALPYFIYSVIPVYPYFILSTAFSLSIGAGNN